MRGGQIYDLPNTETAKERKERSHHRPRGFLLSKEEDCLKGEEASGQRQGKESEERKVGSRGVALGEAQM